MIRLINTKTIFLVLNVMKKGLLRLLVQLMDVEQIQELKL